MGLHLVLLFLWKIKITKLYGPFWWMEFNCFKTIEPLWGDSLLLVPRTFWYSFNRPWKSSRFSWSWSHLAVLNSGPLDRESIIHHHCSFSPSLLCSIAPLLQLKHFLWYTVGFHYRADKNTKVFLVNYVLKENFKLIVSWSSLFSFYKVT